MRLGYAGLIPFVVGAALVWLVWPEAHPYVTLALSAYAAVIVSFLGGIHWGLAMRNPDPPRFLLLWGVVPSLLAWLAVMLVARYGAAYGLHEGTMALAGLAAFLGHLFPVFFRFQGGKGVATALGVLLGYSWVLGLAVAASWLIVAVFFRYSSLASLVAAVFAPVYYIFGDGVAWYLDKSILLAMALMSLLLLWRHAQNINRLLKGTEPKLGARKT